MQYGPDGLPVSNVSILVGPPLKTPAPVPVTTTETVIGPLIYDTADAQKTAAGNVLPEIPYAVAVADEGQELTGRATLINFEGNGVNAVYDGGGAVTVYITDTVGNTVAAGPGISINSSNSVSTITNLGILAVQAGNGISTVTNSGTATITNNGILAVQSGNGISTVTNSGTATITNNGVTSIVAGSGISISQSTGTVTINSSLTETVYIGGNATGNLTPNRYQGSIQKFTLTGNITLNVPTNMASGQSLTLILTQDSAGNRLLDANVAYLFASGFQTLSTNSGAIDMLNIFSDGTTYYATLTVGYS